MTLRNHALLLLARREHSRFELQRKLQKKFTDQQEINKTIDDLNAEGWQSDQRFAAAYLRSRITKGYGPIYIRNELHTRGVVAEIIEQCIAEAEVNWFELANEVRLKRFGITIPKEFALRAKQMRFLQYRGFDFECIQFAVQNNNDRGVMNDN
jgi:regulatory protein